MPPIESFVKICRNKFNWKIGFVNGCFDLLHDGHINFLKKAKKYCDVMIVAVNSDDSIRLLKGEGRPINKLNQRIEAINKLDIADYIIGFGSEDELEYILNHVRPDVLIKSSEYKNQPITGQILAEQVVFIARTNDVSTSALLK